MAKSKKRAAGGRMVCPKRYKGAKVKTRRISGGTRCYIVKKTGQWRFVAKVRAKGGKRSAKRGKRCKRCGR